MRAIATDVVAWSVTIIREPCKPAEPQKSRFAKRILSGQETMYYMGSEFPSRKRQAVGQWTRPVFAHTDI